MSRALSQARSPKQGIQIKQGIHVLQKEELPVPAQPTLAHLCVFLPYISTNAGVPLPVIMGGQGVKGGGGIPAGFGTRKWPGAPGAGIHADVSGRVSVFGSKAPASRASAAVGATELCAVGDNCSYARKLTEASPQELWRASHMLVADQSCLTTTAFETVVL